tara:strand:+ start:271 stop:840 length:570 start_codon:yes stop_codon:yes gene_type:complete
MAASDPILPVRRTFFEGDVAYRRAVSEGLLRKFAESSNYIVDKLYLQEKFAINGFFNANSFDNGVGGSIYIENDSDIEQYYLSIANTGSSGTSSFNCRVYDATGVYVSDLFTSSTLTISGDNGTTVIVGKKDLTTTPTTFDNGRAGGHTISNGTLNITTLLAGYTVEPFIETNGVAAFNLMFNMKLQEQ